MRHEGRLDKDLFAVAMHLINNKLAGKEVPTSLPNSLVPPSMRGDFGAGTQEVLTSGPSSTTKDLFDLFDDSAAPAPGPPPAAFPPAQASPKPFSTATYLPQPPSRKPTAPPSRQMSPAPAAGGFGMASFGESLIAMRYESTDLSSSGCLSLPCSAKRFTRRRFGRSGTVCTG